MKGRGYVYFVQAGPADGPIKIGITQSPGARMSNLRTSSHAPLKMLRCVLCEDAEATESTLHERFAADRTHGEWFRASVGVLAMAAGAVPVPGMVVDADDNEAFRIVQTCLRLPAPLLERIDALVSPEPTVDGPLRCRASVLREAIRIGLQALADERDALPPKTEIG